MANSIPFNRLIPELYCSDFERSLAFYRTLGFRVVYMRPEGTFAFFEREGAQLMIEQPTRPDRGTPTAVSAETSSATGFRWLSIRSWRVSFAMPR